MGYLPKDLYDLDLNELESLLINRRKGVANECYMIGILSRSALSEKVPTTAQEMYPYMFPKPKTYIMPEFLKDKYYRENGGGF